MITTEREFGGTTKFTAMKLAKLLVSIFIIVVVGYFSATQYFANKLDYHPSLGPNFHGIYPPYKIVLWQKQFPQYPTLHNNARLSQYAVVSLLSIMFVYSLIRSARTAKAAAGIHGSARFATLDDLKENGLLDNVGVYLGTFYDSARDQLLYLQDSTRTHKAVIAGSRGGKTAGIVIPNALSYKNSMIILDIKREIWELTSGWRKRYAGNYCIKFDPASADENAYWNPLDEIRIGTDNEARDIQNLCSILADPEGQGKDHWHETAFSLLMGCVAHVLYLRENEGTPATLHSVDVLLTGYKLQEYFDASREGICLPRPMSQVYEEMYSYPHKDGKPHELAAKAGKDQADRPDQEGASVLSTAKSFLTIYRDPIIARNTSASHFKAPDIKHADKPLSLYVCVQPGDMERLKPLLRLFFTMVFYNMTEALTTDDLGHEVLAILDEFATLGKMEIISKGIGFLAGYGCMLMLVLQDLAQLQKAYGKPDPIMPNINTLATYPTGNIETAKYLSEMSGEATFIKKSTSNSGDRNSIFLNKVSTSYQEVKGHLLTPDDVMRSVLKSPKRDKNGLITEPGDVLIFLNGVPPIIGKQSLYFMDDIFLQRSKVPPLPHSDRLREIDSFKNIVIDYQPDGAPSQSPTEVPPPSLSKHTEETDDTHESDELAHEII